ncbi:MAG: DUF4062 domain-containing protein [Candidatus Omnitrophota bacterium]
MKIFISSTYEDLKNERREVIATIDRVGQAIAMEKFFSSNHQSKHVCVRELQQCDGIIVILGGRYGHIDPEEKISITEIEYNTAKSLGLKCFVFIKKITEKGWKSCEVDPSTKTKHNQFRNKLELEHFRREFTSSDELGKEIIGSIRQYEIDRGILGARVSPFVSPEIFFKPFSNPSGLFNHTFPLIGRTDYLNRLKHFVSSSKRILIMYGRGGIGKSKILFEFSKICSKNKSKWGLLFLREGVSLDNEASKQLPAKPCVIVVDDAHRRSDIGFLSAIAMQYSDRIKLIFSSRPQGKDYVHSTLLRAGFDISEIEEIESVENLTHDEVKKLSEQVLGPKFRQFAESLFVSTKDCPLATVVGGQLISKKLIDPKILERQSEFQEIVFNRFQEVLLGDDISKKIKPELCRSILSLLSALSPIPVNDQRFQKQAATFLNVQPFELMDTIGLLENNGILLRRGYKLRIIPDVLSDHILYNTCLTKQGDTTGYAKQIFDAFSNIMPENILSNIAELDWRVNQGGKKIDLFSDIWRIIEKEFHEASNYGRSIIFENLERVAYFQPARVLALIEVAIRNPATKQDKQTIFKLANYDHQSVLNKLPNILRSISYNFEYLPRCCELLWKLGRDDARPTNPHPEHAMRVLESLAGYDVGKPVAISASVLEAMDSVLKQPEVHQHFHSPLDILDAFLSKDGLTTRSEGHKILWKPFAISFKNTQPLRKKCIELMRIYISSKSPKVVLRTIRSLADDLRSPLGYLGRPISKKEKDQWLPERLEILEILSTLVRTTKEPVVHLSVVSELQWYAKHDSQVKIRAKASEIIAAVPRGFEFRITQGFWNCYEKNWDGNGGYDKFQKRIQSEIEQAVVEFLKRFRTAKKIFSYLNNKFQHFQKYGIENINPVIFLSKIAEKDPLMTYQICRFIVKYPCPLEICFHSMLYAVRKNDERKTISLIGSAVATGRRDLCFSIAHDYRWGWHQNFERADVEIIKKLLKSPNHEVKATAIDSLSNFKGELEWTGIKLALSVDIGEDEKLGENLCGIFDTKHGISPNALKNSDIEILLSKLLKIKELRRHYHIDEFLKYVSKRNLLLSANFLINRYEYAIKNNKRESGYQPMPYSGFHNAFKCISENPSYKDILRRIREMTLKEKWLSSFWLPRLFEELSDGFCLKSLEVLEEWLNSGNEKKIAGASLLLREAPSDFVFTNHSFAQKMLEKAYNKSIECYRKVKGNLAGSAISGERSGTPGQPMPQDVILRDSANGMCKKLLVGSPAFWFYDTLRKHAEESIRDDLLRDEEIFDQ